jgi:pyruvate carboxylase subunit B
MAGDSVDAGAVVAVIEAMKMNNEIRSPVAGVVESVSVGAGDRVKPGDVLMRLRAAEA